MNLNVWSATSYYSPDFSWYEKSWSHAFSNDLGQLEDDSFFSGASTYYCANTFGLLYNLYNGFAFTNTLLESQIVPAMV